MLEIRCPYCGKRSQNEFSYGGDGNIKRPTLGEEINTKDWDDFVYFRDNPRGKHTELWQHFRMSDSGLKHQEILLPMRYLQLVK